MLFKPKYVFNTIADIDVEFLQRENIKALILDLDNTLTTHNNPIPNEKIAGWLAKMKAEGVPMLIMSNNHYERVKPFSESLGLDFVCDAGKPLGKGYKEAIGRLELPKKEVATVGDQIYTDVLGSNFHGIRCIFTFPIVYETGFWFRVKRTLEKPLLPKKERALK
ncbi:MAG: YqeG family HAD IIIA-type phosphatase [Oscillospiraceae bacterium]|nr:YqeG family HAD IIIA-type phosphatase [Oscillospiraceae bacterium]